MPNHVTNIIALSGDKDKIHAMLEAIQNEEYGVGSVDFNKILPMPESLNIEAGSSTDKGLKAYRGFVEVYTLGGTINMDKLKDIPAESEEIFLRQRTDIDRKDWQLGKTAWNNIQNYGAPTWYEWAIQNWGTKWGAYGYDSGMELSEDGNLWFQTAWSAPHPILAKLSEMYPEVTMEHKWADEDIGSNCGQRTYLGGEMIDEYIPDYGVRSVEFAAEVMDADPSDWGLVLNKTGTDYIYTGKEYESIELFGKPALFTNDRLTDMRAKHNKPKSGLRTVIRILALLLLLAGVTALVYPYAMQFLYNRQADADYKQFVEHLPELPDTDKLTGAVSLEMPYAELYRQMQEYNEQIYENGQSELTDPWAYEQSSFQLDEYGFEENIIGYIEIPSIEVTLPIYLGASNANMAKGAAHLSQTSLPIGGENCNSVICAHRGYSTATMFNRLVELKEGDEVIVTNLWYRMTYKVTATTTIQSDEADKLKIQDGRDMLTLFTCYYQSGRKDRFVVYCERYEP